MKFRRSLIEGCYEVEAPKYPDHRGWFLKSYQESIYRPEYLSKPFVEAYFSSSKRSVVRGMHFQTPTHDHDKLVLCISGSVMDVVCDLRQSSETYGRCHTVDLRAGDGRGVLMCRGLAHGFCAHEDETVLAYLVTSEHSPDHDAGIHWKSLPIVWPVKNPVVSKRDEQFPSLDEFETPFS